MIELFPGVSDPKLRHREKGEAAALGKQPSASPRPSEPSPASRSTSPSERPALRQGGEPAAAPTHSGAAALHAYLTRHGGTYVIAVHARDMVSLLSPQQARELAHAMTVYADLAERPGAVPDEFTGGLSGTPREGPSAESSGSATRIDDRSPLSASPPLPCTGEGA